MFPNGLLFYIMLHEKPTRRPSEREGGVLPAAAGPLFTIKTPWTYTHSIYILHAYIVKVIIYAMQYIGNL